MPMDEMEKSQALSEPPREEGKDQADENDYSMLRAEAKRLLDFKRRNIKHESLTTCPKCSQLVDVHVSRCPHCNSNIAEHLEGVREELDRLDAIAAELYELHSKYLGRLKDKIAERPLWSRIKTVIIDRQLREDLQTVMPALLLFFILVIVLRVIGNGVLFWSVALAGGAVGYFQLTKSSIRRYVTVDIYRMTLVLGLIMCLSSAVFRPMTWWPGVVPSVVQVMRPIANIREAATTDSEIVTTVRQGERLTVIDRDGAWYQVRTFDDQTGWVYSALVAD